MISYRESPTEVRSVADVQAELVAVEDLERKTRASRDPFVHPVWGPRTVMSATTPWAGEGDGSSGPNMLSAEERRYLRWVASRAPDDGAVLEIGPWLGQSTRCLLEGLPVDRSLTTVDDFIWRASWMNDYLLGTELPVPANHEDFFPLFQSLNPDHGGRLTVRRGRLNPYDGNEDVTPFAWHDGPIRLLVVDCGRTQAVNETWYGLLQSSFIPGETLIVMQDWRLFREIPFRWYNQTRLFTDAHAENLWPLHELNDGGLASFLYVES
jgi:hypothetical protein